MQNIKQEAMKAISKLPETANIDDIMYELYVIDKVRKGKAAAEDGQLTTVDDLREEIKTW